MIAVKLGDVIDLDVVLDAVAKTRCISIIAWLYRSRTYILCPAGL